MKTIYNTDDIFQKIPGDDENILMTIPTEICETMGWEPGDTLNINVEGEGLVIQKHE